MELKPTDLILRKARSAVSKDGRGLGLACGRPSRRVQSFEARAPRGAGALALCPGRPGMRQEPRPRRINRPVSPFRKGPVDRHEPWSTESAQQIPVMMGEGGKSCEHSLIPLRIIPDQNWRLYVQPAIASLACPCTAAQFVYSTNYSL